MVEREAKVLDQCLFSHGTQPPFIQSLRRRRPFCDRFDILARRIDRCMHL